METTRSEPTAVKHPTNIERKSDRELVVTRTLNASARHVFAAFTKSDLFARWWVPKSLNMNLLSCELDARVGGKYKLVFKHQGATMDFFGTYREVTPNSRLVWTNEESPDGSITTVSMEEQGGKTRLTIHELYPSKKALDDAGGASSSMPETMQQLEDFLATMA